MPKKVMGTSTPDIEIPGPANPNAPEIPDEPVEVPEPVEDLPVEEETPPLEDMDELPEDDATPDPLEPLTLETADPNEKLWENGPTVGQALEWKTEYKKI